MRMEYDENFKLKSFSFLLISPALMSTTVREEMGHYWAIDNMRLYLNF